MRSLLIFVAVITLLQSCKKEDKGELRCGILKVTKEYKLHPQPFAPDSELVYFSEDTINSGTVYRYEEEFQFYSKIGYDDFLMKKNNSAVVDYGKSIRHCFDSLSGTKQYFDHLNGAPSVSVAQCK